MFLKFLLTFIFSLHTLYAASGGGPEKGSEETLTSYSINVMWVNSRPAPDQLYVLPGDEDAVREKLRASPLAWAASNPRAVVNVWFDSAHASKDVGDATRELCRGEPGADRVQFRDIRELPPVTENPEVFSDKMPVFYRADLGRACVLDHQVQADGVAVAVYADWDITPVPDRDLFDAETGQTLDTYGIVFAASQTTPLRYENGFQMLSGRNPRIVEAHKVRDCPSS